MPKIIKNLHETIVTKTIDLFMSEGIDAIDMRRIAKECHIAVGTLYNYFPNKKDILYQGFEQLWKASLTLLDQWIDLAPQDNQLLTDYAKAFYAEMDKKNGIGLELVRLELINTSTDPVSKDSLLMSNTSVNHLQKKQMSKVLIKAFSLNEDIIAQPDFQHLIVSLNLLILTNHHADEDFLLFLNRWVKSFTDLL